MISKIHSVTIYVTDHDEALAYYTDKLGFEKRSDVSLPSGFRWLTVGLPAQPDLQVTLELVGDSERAHDVGGTGKNSTWVLHTDDCEATRDELVPKGVDVSEISPRPYGRECVLTDLYGNSYALVQPA